MNESESRYSSYDAILIALLLPSFDCAGRPETTVFSGI
jgi:hypothetical protein